MAPDPARLFLDFSAAKLNQLTARIVECLGRVREDQIWIRGSDSENAVGNLVLHLCGNVRQWIVSGIGGAPDIRHRDAEFAARGGTGREELIAQLRASVGEAIAVLEGLPASRLGEPIRIQAYETTVLAAIYHVVEHFSQHAGQIFYATKLATGGDLGFYSHLARPTHKERVP